MYYYLFRAKAGGQVQLLGNVRCYTETYIYSKYYLQLQREGENIKQYKRE